MASVMACSSSSFDISVLMNSSWRAPALSAIAFHPFVVATVMRIAGTPLASRTGRITPGITERTALFECNNRSRIGRSPFMMLCSIFSFPFAALNRM